MDQKIINNKNKTQRRRELRQESTKSEQLAWRLIRNNQLGYKFRRQYSIGPYITDFCCAKLKIIVEIDGETHNNEESYNRDMKRDTYLKEQGFVVKRYSDEYVLDHCEGFCDDLMLLCDKVSRLKPSS
jgi:very-short-patch-repair endonuclease